MEIKPNPRNPRKITDKELERLSESIRKDPEFMRLRPIVVDADGLILGGNMRFRAITEVLGMDKIPDDWITRADNLTEDQRKRFVVVDNSPDGMSGEWDFEVMEEDWGLPELEDWGFETTMHIDGITELQDVDEDDEPSGKRDLGNKKYQIKPVLYSDTVGVYEKAILATGEQNYAKALIEICKFYLENNIGLEQ